MINEYYNKSIGGSRESFANFIRINTKDLDINSHEDDIIEFLAQRIAQNLYVFEDNKETAKSDYIFLLGILMKKGILFKQVNDNNDPTQETKG
jgi:hypothetical protein